MFLDPKLFWSKTLVVQNSVSRIFPTPSIVTDQQICFFCFTSGPCFLVIFKTALVFFNIHRRIKFLYRKLLKIQFPSQCNYQFCPVHAHFLTLRASVSVFSSPIKINIIVTADHSRSVWSEVICLVTEYKKSSVITEYKMYSVHW